MSFAAALEAAEGYRDAAKAALADRVKERSMDADQRAAHGFSWIATSVAALAAVADWLRLHDGGTDLDRNIATLIFAETLGQLTGGLPMGQNEIFRPVDLGMSPQAALLAARCEELLGADHAAVRADVAHAMASSEMPSESLHNAELDAIRDQYRRFTNSEILPHAHRWHLANDLIPDDTISAMAALGTFGVCIPTEYGGLGLSKLVMCVITEELSRGWIGAGSLSTRSEIAGGSRSDMMTMLVRTMPDAKGYAGLSMLLVPKPRGTDSDPFPATGMSGSEIDVLGYRGMREYALQFDGMLAPDDALLGGEEGQGFKQLMRTFEGARIQTAARAVGVAKRALELGLDYAVNRKQFGKAIIGFPRVADKIAMSVADFVMTRELTYAAARAKDSGKRCDIEAGMAKLLAARAAWSNADASLQIHGGNGYALEYEISRVLCDARILNIFEGAAEIQAQVIAKGLMGGVN
ncbi:acyl-CoA dehydrogenase family protein [Sphingorhabdus sp.]|uniref:acyl-CoA dehydrogenase family protein n=1 Tax=Sphingorhabdus sp. TaxID=1902408 RepID=UPI0039BC4173